MIANKIMSKIMSQSLEKIGDTDISAIGDGTLTGAISTNANSITELNNALGSCQFLVECATKTWMGAQDDSYRGFYIVWISDTGVMQAETYIPLDILNIGKSAAGYPVTVYKADALIGQWCYVRPNEIGVYPFDGYKAELYGIK